MPLMKEETYTIDDIYALPDGERAELIDGHMYMMAPPSRKHQRISTRLVSIIDRYIEEHKGKCEVYAAPFAVYLDERSNTRFFGNDGSDVGHDADVIVSHYAQGDGVLCTL